MRAAVRLLAVLPFVTFLPACGSTPGAPSQVPLTLTGESTKTTLAVGESATIHFTLTNISSKSLALSLSDSCLMTPIVVDRRDGREVDQGGGGMACADVESSLTLPPAESRSLSVEVRAADGFGPFIPLRSAGEYWIYAKVHDTVYHVQSAPITITVR